MNPRLALACLLTGRMAGEFKWIHYLAIDRDGNLYTSEVGFGRRVQKFVRSGGAF